MTLIKGLKGNSLTHLCQKKDYFPVLLSHQTIYLIDWRLKQHIQQKERLNQAGVTRGRKIYWVSPRNEPLPSLVASAHGLFFLLKRNP